MCSELAQLYPTLFQVADDNRLTTDVEAARDVLDAEGERALGAWRRMGAPATAANRTSPPTDPAAPAFGDPRPSIILHDARPVRLYNTTRVKEFFNRLLAAACKQEEMFHSNELMYFICSSAWTKYNECATEAAALDDDLSLIVQAVQIHKVRKSFKAKLLNDMQFDDARHEVAIAGVGTRFFDAGSIHLEEGLPKSGKNSDVRGRKAGRDGRIEVTSVHENWPPSIPESVQRVMESASVDTGYSALLRIQISDEKQGTEVKELIEKVWTAKVDGSEYPAEIGGVRVRQTTSEFAFEFDNGPLESIEFDPDQVLCQVVQQPATTRAMMGKHEWQDLSNHNPPSVKTFSDARRARSQSESVETNRSLDCPFW